jgi:hypothetical protein
LKVSPVQTQAKGLKQASPARASDAAQGCVNPIHAQQLRESAILVLHGIQKLNTEENLLRFVDAMPEGLPKERNFRTAFKWLSELALVVTRIISEPPPCPPPMPTHGVN